MTINLHYIKPKSALNQLKRKIPYGWDLNIYRGCSHNCHYCYAISSTNKLGGNFFSDLYIKEDIDKLLDKELSSPNWKGDIINIGGVTDSYQEIERKEEMMRKILKVMIKHKNPIIISTKSDLILRDLDLIDELSELTYVNIATTITTVDKNIARKLEPGSSAPESRFNILREVKNKTKACTGLHVMPIIPYLTDSEDNFDKMFEEASKIGVDYVLCGALYLLGQTKKHFLDFTNNIFPEEYKLISEMYVKGSASKEYKDQLYKMINRLKEKYGINSNYMKFIKAKLLLNNENDQTKLVDY